MSMKKDFTDAQKFKNRLLLDVFEDESPEARARRLRDIVALSEEGKALIANYSHNFALSGLMRFDGARARYNPVHSALDVKVINPVTGKGRDMTGSLYLNPDFDDVSLVVASVRELSRFAIYFAMRVDEMYRYTFERGAYSGLAELSLAELAELADRRAAKIFAELVEADLTEFAPYALKEEPSPQASKSYLKRLAQGLSDFFP